MPRSFLPIISLCGFMLSGLCANVAFWKMLAEANARLSEDKKLSWWWWTLSKYIRLWKEHKRLCADGPWRLLAVFFLGSAFVFMILVAASFPIPPR